jgi:AhpD family alkylhydroperoxidase
MPYVAPLLDAQASDPAKKLFHSIQSAFGMVPNIFRTMGHAPAVLQSTLGLNEAIQHDLDPKLRELAYNKASQLNHCGYCLHYHQNFARKVGLSETQLKDLENFEQSNAFSDLEKAVLRFTDQWVKQGKVDSAVVQQLASKLTPTHLITLAATVGLAMWTNRFNETFVVALP